MIIDSHLHVWDLERCVYPWLDASAAPIDRTLELAEIEPALDRNGVGSVVLVQSADDDADTAYMLEVAAQNARVVGVVAYAPLDHPEALSRRLERYLEDPIVVGVRALIHNHPASWTDRPVVEESLAMLARAGMPLDVPTTGPEGLAPVTGWLQRHPDLRVVVDHLGKPPVGAGDAEMSRWRELLGAVAEHPLAVAKLSGLYSGTGPLDSWTVDAVRRVADDALGMFGPTRLLAGGDWPIAVLAGGYDRVWGAVRASIEQLDEGDRDEVLGHSAVRAYAIDPQRLAAARALASVPRDPASATTEETR